MKTEAERDALLFLASLRFGAEWIVLLGRDERLHVRNLMANGLVEIRGFIIRRVHLTEGGAKVVARHFG